MLSVLHRIIIIVAALVWAGLVFNLFQPFPVPWNKVLTYFFIGIAALRCFELVMYRALLGAGGQSKSVDMALIFLIGSFHASWLAKQRAQNKAKA